MGHILKCHEIVKTDFVLAENCYIFEDLGRRFIDFESAQSHQNDPLGCAVAKIDFEIDVLKIFTSSKGKKK